MSSLDVEKIRAQFPFFSQKNPPIYLDTAATSHKPQIVIDALVNFYSYEYATVHRAVYKASREATDKYNEARASVAQFIHAREAEEIVFTRGTTEGINLIALSWGKSFIKEGDEILVSEVEHHSNFLPWQILCQEKKAHLKTFPVNDRGEIILEELIKRLSSKVKLISLPHISNVLGTVHPIKKIIEKGHEVGAKVCIDGAQSVSRMPIDVQDLDADFFVFSSHKCYGPTGVGVLYGKKEILETMPPLQGGGDMVERVSLEKTTYQKPPLRFEAGTPMIAEVIGLKKALDFIKAIGIEAIDAHEKELISYAEDYLKKIKGLRIIGEAEEKRGVISFVIDSIHPLDLGVLLDLKGISIRTGHQCSQLTMDRFNLSSVCRISFGVYTTLEEIDRCVRAIEEIVQEQTSLLSQ